MSASNTRPVRTQGQSVRGNPGALGAAVVIAETHEVTEGHSE